ncbi:helix-turn-helix domain-containing protein (plasmid) [Skermanella sp. TT6]|uniref:Helix-turn-helix domain-containing protein n=1 Tax=Skermanella cutis TaxID=2775420 RepID=A0ABX7BI59_9PROT|nr:helix-turn-helix domain-containing protein [Skermanella sp. TT6]QQP94062.1 helix-turn-helix domain-containing protein [Skermanella sp. TT6]
MERSRSAIREEVGRSPKLAGKKFLTPEELAELLDISPKTLQKWRARKTGPQHIRVSYRVIRYELEEVERWLATRAEQTAH